MPPTVTGPKPSRILFLIQPATLVPGQKWKEENKDPAIQVCKMSRLSFKCSCSKVVHIRLFGYNFQNIKTGYLVFFQNNQTIIPVPMSKGADCFLSIIM